MIIILISPFSTSVYLYFNITAVVAQGFGRPKANKKIMSFLN